MCLLHPFEANKYFSLLYFEYLPSSPSECYLRITCAKQLKI